MSAKIILLRPPLGGYITFPRTSTLKMADLESDKPAEHRSGGYNRAEQLPSMQNKTNRMQQYI